MVHDQESGVKERSNGTGSTVDLGEFLHGEVFPRLTADQIYKHESHQWQKTPGKWRGGCPFHESKSKTSFYIDTESLLWRCSSCEIGGGPLQYIWRLRGRPGVSPRGRDFVDMVRELAELANVPFPERNLSPEAQERAQKRDSRRAILETVLLHCRSVLWSSSGNQARDYLHSRGFTDDNLQDLCLGLYPSVGEVENALRKAGHPPQSVRESGVIGAKLPGYIFFPWLDEFGWPLTLYGTWQSKVPPEGKPKKMALPNPRGEIAEAEAQTKRSPLYFDRARREGHQDLVLVEGLTDAALLQVRGDTRVISPVCNKLSFEQARTLARQNVRSVIICLDPDGGGRNGTSSCIKTLEAEGITAYVAPWLPNNLDPDDFLLAHGLDAWKDHVGQAIHAYRFMARNLLATIRGAK